MGVGRKKWSLGLTLVLDSGGEIAGEPAKPPGPSSYQGPKVPATAKAPTPSRKRLLRPASPLSEPDSPKLLQECSEARRTWGACLPLPRPEGVGETGAGEGGGGGGDMAVW